MDTVARSPQKSKYLELLEHLLGINATGVKPALTEASDLIAATLHADKVDAFVYEESTHTLVAIGTSNTPLARREQALGLDRLPVANGGRAVQVYRTGTPFQHGHLDTDTEELLGIRESLGIRSTVCVPLNVNGVRRGALQIDSPRPEAFTDRDCEFLAAVANWIGLMLHRSELIEQQNKKTQHEARRMAAEEIVTVLAHDLRNHLSPLMNRILVLRRLAERDGHAVYTREAATLAGSVARLSDLLSDLLDVARLERGLFSLDCRAVSLCDLVREATEAMDSVPVTFQIEASDEIVANVDPKRIRQAVSNLLSNAARHAAGSTVTIRVGWELRSGREAAVISVEDNGPGIAPDAIPQLSDPFVRGATGPGLGIGLYLVRGIVEAHGGKLEIESALGSGSVFRLVLPGSSPLQ